MTHKDYLNKVHRSGCIWNLSMLFVLLAYPIIVAVIYKATPDWTAFLKGCLATVPMYWAVGLIETITYTPMLGAGASYLSFVTGNISNLKLPCALNALDACDVKANSEEGEIVSTISVAVSSITTTIIIIIGVVLLVPLTPILNSPTLAPAFAQILPSLFGGLGVVFISKNWKIALIPCLLMIVAFIFVDALNASTVGIMVPIGALIAIGCARFFYKKTHWLDK